MKKKVTPGATGNFLRHSLAHLGSSQVEAIATILSFHLHSGETYQSQGWYDAIGICLYMYLYFGFVCSSCKMSRTSPSRWIFVPLLSLKVPSWRYFFCLVQSCSVTLFSLKGLPPPQSSYISGSQQHPSRSKTSAFGRREAIMVFRSSDSMKLHTWD